MTNELKLSPPWETFCHEVEALFGKDPDIKVKSFTGIDDVREIRLYVDNPEKAEALDAILPRRKLFGEIAVRIVVVPANIAKDSLISLYEKAFEGNPAVNYIADNPPTDYDFASSYVVFKKDVVQFFNDDLSDIHGNKSMLYQEIAEDIFEDHGGLFFCTDIS